MYSLVEHSLGRLLRDRRRTSAVGDFVVSVARVDSTNTKAVSLARRGAPHGSVVMADEQSAGVGRWKRRWASSPGGLYLSAVMRPEVDGRPSVSLLPIAASVAVAESLQEVAGVTGQIFWPNDVQVQNKKIAGILCEVSFDGEHLDFCVVGIGVNLNQLRFEEDLQGRATSLRLVTGVEQARLPFAACLLERLQFWWESLLGEGGEVTERWHALSEGDRGCRVKVVSREGLEFVGVTDGLSADGGLRIRHGGDLRVLYSEEVLFVRASD